MHWKTRHSNTLVDLLLLAAMQVFMMVYLDIRYLFLDTIVTGGDTASWHAMADHLKRVILPEGRLTGWDMGNFCGYPNFTFYFLPPFLLAVLASCLSVIPLAIALKGVIALGLFLLPVTTYFGLRAMDYRFPVPVIGASVSVLFLFNESYTMFGGNILSTLTGEFCYMIAFALFAYFIGSLHRGIRTGTGLLKNGILLGLIGLTHLFVFIPAVCLLIYWFLAGGRGRYLFKVSLAAFGLMAFWILPLMAYRDPFTTPVYMIWQPFVNWRYAFVGIGLGLVFIGPRLALAALSSPRTFRLPLIAFSGLGAFTLAYVVLAYVALGPGFWDTGLEMTPLSVSPLGERAGSLLNSWAVPVALGLFALVTAAGFRAWRSPSRFQAFCVHTAAVALLALLILAFLGEFSLIARSLPYGRLRTSLLGETSLVVLGACVTAGFFFLYRRFIAFLVEIPLQDDSHRFLMLLALAFGCVVGYFSAHFLQIPDIRFLPPLLFVLILVFFAETLEPLLTKTSLPGRRLVAVLISCGCVVTVIFGTTKAGNWFRFDNMGYQSMPGFGEFRALNDYLAQVYQKRFENPLNAPRVGYEKSDLYGRYGGDRVFESLPFFSGRQTLEGIHYASSFASKPMAFLQTAFSRDIKTPVSYILSRMNPGRLPSYFDLYNVSQLILVSDEAKKAVGSISLFEKEKDFGPLSVYRYTHCSGLYVDLPKLVPVRYAGKPWVGDFFQWYKTADPLEVLLVPASYVKSRLDREVLSDTVSSLQELPHLKKTPLDREGLSINAHLEPLRIRFTTNKIGIPHLIKVSYFPNWKVKGAEGVYPVSPHLMLVIPREREVVLTYGRTFWESLGIGITAGTLFLLFLTGLPPLRKLGLLKDHANPPFVPPLEKGGEEGVALEKGGEIEISRGLDSRSRFSPARASFSGNNRQEPFSLLHGKLRSFLIIFVLLTAAGLIIGGAVLRNTPVRTYISGYRHYHLGIQLQDKERLQEAGRFFEKAIKVMAPIVEARRSYDHQDVLHCMLFTGLSYERLGEPGKAEDLYETILKEYPYSRYVGECNVKIARLKKAERDPALEKALMALGRGDQTLGLLLIEEALDQTQLSLAFLQRAIAEDPSSEWAKYARQDMDAERQYLEGKLLLLRALGGHPDLERSLSRICDELHR